MGVFGLFDFFLLTFSFRRFGFFFLFGSVFADLGFQGFDPNTLFGECFLVVVGLTARSRHFVR